MIPFEIHGYKLGQDASRDNDTSANGLSYTSFIRRDKNVTNSTVIGRAPTGKGGPIHAKNYLYLES